MLGRCIEDCSNPSWSVTKRRLDKRFAEVERAFATAKVTGPVRLRVYNCFHTVDRGSQLDDFIVGVDSAAFGYEVPTSGLESEAGEANTGGGIDETDMVLEERFLAFLKKERHMRQPPNLDVAARWAEEEGAIGAFVGRRVKQPVGRTELETIFGSVGNELRALGVKATPVVTLLGER